MNSSRGRPPKDRIKHPRGVAEGAGRALKEHLPPPERPFSEDIVDEVMRGHTEGPCDLGPYLEREDSGAHLGGRSQTIRFPVFWHTWFSRQTPQRLSALDEMVDERLEREAVRRFFRRLKHIGIAAVIAGFAGARWFSEQIAWFMAKLPILREFWILITGSGKP